jgi:hypothetical protein
MADVAFAKNVEQLEMLRTLAVKFARLSARTSCAQKWTSMAKRGPIVCAGLGPRGVGL